MLMHAKMPENGGRCAPFYCTLLRNFILMEIILDTLPDMLRLRRRRLICAHLTPCAGMSGG